MRAFPLQYEVLSGYGEDGAMMQRAHGGAPSVNITVPTRYLHSHNGVLHRDDFDRAVDLCGGDHPAAGPSRRLSG